MRLHYSCLYNILAKVPEADIFYHHDANLSLPAEIKEKESGFSAVNPSLRNVHYVRGSAVSDARLSIYSIQKCLIKIN